MINSSLSKDSFPPHLSFVNSILLSYIHCIISRSNSFLFTSFYIGTIVLTLPLCIFIFYHGLQECRQNCSPSAAAPMSHSHSFSCQIAIMELIGIFGFALSCVAINRVHFDLLLVAVLISKFTWYRETFFHILTCVERYLAVVHPFTYLRVKDEIGIRIKIIITGCVWVLCFIGIGLSLKGIANIIDLSFLVLSLIIIFSCSLSVLCILIHPGPGEQDSTKEKVGRSKLRAFYTIVAILVVLLLRFAWGLFWTLHGFLERRDICLILTFTFWFNLPSSLILPLLFLLRTGKLECCKKNTQ